MGKDNTDGAAPVVDIADVAGMVVKVRDALRELTAAYEVKRAQLQAAIDNGEQVILSRMPKDVTSMRTQHGTIIVSTVQKATVIDWPGFHEFVQSSGRFDLLQKRVSTSGVKAFLDDESNEKGLPPPGVVVKPERTVSIRAPSKSGFSSEKGDPK